MGATRHCAPNPSHRKAEEAAWTLPRAPPQLLSDSPNKNLLHLLQPVYLLHPVGRGAEMTRASRGTCLGSRGRQEAAPAGPAPPRPPRTRTQPGTAPTDKP